MREWDTEAILCIKYRNVLSKSHAQGFKKFILYI